MKNFKLTIEYDGTGFHGWQIQARGQRTVQGEIENALKKIFKRRTPLMGSGRTDSGVHAQGQVANFHADTTMPTAEIQRAINANLPEDITIISVQEADKKFHAQFFAKQKTYRYTILNRPFRCSQQRDFVHYHPYPLSISAMRRVAAILKGRHDFRSLTATDPATRSQKKNTVRTISRLTIKKDHDLIHIEITANGFLYKMVRNIVGLLLAAGRGKILPRDVKKILDARNRAKAGVTALAKGLCLIDVKY